jgi:hypothetical protein
VYAAITGEGDPAAGRIDARIHHCDVGRQLADRGVTHQVHSEQPR